MSSNNELFEKELDEIREAMEQSNYPKQFVEKTIEKGARRRRMPLRREQESDLGVATTKIPFVSGMSQ